MKAKQTIGRLIVGCVITLGLVANLQAESYHSAKDPDLVPLPFNPHPELETVEVSPGIFVYDDTGIPDTQQQIISRKIRKTAAERAKTIASDPVLAKAAQEKAQAAQQAAYAVQYENEFASWNVKEILLPDGSQLTAEGVQSQTESNLLSLASVNSAAYAQQQTEVNAFIQTNSIGITTNLWFDTKGNPHLFDHIDEGGTPAYKTTLNTESANTVGADKLWPGGISGMNLTGTNLAIGLIDGGDPLTNHQEFVQSGARIVELFGPSPMGTNSHATHTCGTIAAWGVTNAAKGFANRAAVWATGFDNDQTKMPIMAVTNGGVRISNHSYVYPAGWDIINLSGTLYWLWRGDTALGTNQDWHFGYYDGIAKTNDQIIYTAQNYLPVFSAGNERGTVERGPASQPVGHFEFTNGAAVFNNAVRPLDDANGGFYFSLAYYAVSKNALVVGAVNAITNGYAGSNSVILGTFSSCGPTAEGRIKPDITAAGVNIYSTISSSNTGYALDSGTSMSAPAVTGALGLLTELQKRLYGTNQLLLSSTLKGIVIATADEAGTNAGPDYRFGWGLLNAQSAANLITNNYTSQSLAFIKEVRLMSGDSIQFPVKLTNGSPFRAVFVWTDPPGTPVAPKVNPTNHMLVNDLDLRVISPSGTTNFPWLLNPNSPASAATTGDNTVDNVEEVSIPNPTNGTYLVQVTHKGALLNDLGQTNYQNVSIVLLGNIALPPILPNITSILPNTVSNLVALKWSSEVGRVYRVQSRDDLTAGSWQYATGELSATKTNTSQALSVSGVTNRFYRIAQVR